MARTFTFHAGLALLAACLLGLWCRARRLAVLAGVSGLIAVVPACVRPPSLAPDGVLDETLTIFSHNLLFINTDMTRTLAQIKDADPDIILFQEYTPTHHAALSRALVAEYPYEVHAYKDGSYGQAIYSKLPFLDQPTITTSVCTALGAHAPGNGPQISVRVLLHDEPVTISNVHTDAPGSVGLYRDQRHQFAWLCDQARASRGPAIFAGDFNATNSSQHMAALRESGMTDALDANMLGRRCTWCDRTLLQWAPGIRIDHVMHSRDLWCESARVGTSTGSDHLPVIARFRVQHPMNYARW